MAARVELLRGKTPSRSGELILTAVGAAVRLAGDDLIESRDYRGDREWLILFGVGAAVHDVARRKHVAAGGKVLMWDLGYVGRQKLGGYLRASINHDHPQGLLDRAPADGSRWDVHGIALREDANEAGHIVLVGLGNKSRAYCGNGWEAAKYAELVRRFPNRRIIYRPKKVGDPLRLPCESVVGGDISVLLRGASLVSCRHSNVAVDAVVAGVPFESEDGAATWLDSKQYSEANRLEFMRRLAWFQWRADEAANAWVFFKGIA